MIASNLQAIIHNWNKNDNRMRPYRHITIQQREYSGICTSPPAVFLTTQFNCLLFAIHSDTHNLSSFLDSLPEWVDGVVIFHLSGKIPENIIYHKTTPCLIIRSCQVYDTAALQENIVTATRAKWCFRLNTNESIDPRFSFLDFDSEYIKNSDMVSFYTFYTKDGRHYYKTDTGITKEKCRLLRNNTGSEPPTLPRREGILSAQLAIVHNASNEDDPAFNLTLPLLRLDELYFVADTFRNVGFIGDHSVPNLIDRKLNKITQYLLSAPLQDKSAGLYTGLSGYILFLVQVYLRTGDGKYLSGAYDYIDKTLQYLQTDGKIPLSLCDGLAGIGWLICYLQEKELIDIPGDYLNDLDSTLFNEMKQLCLKQSFDQMHEAISIGWYFLKRRKVLQVEYLINALSVSAIRDHDEIKWKSFHYKLKALKYDFGLAHGMAGILVFLGKCFRQNIQKEICRELISGIFRFYEHNKQDISQCGSFFPTIKIADNYVPGALDQHVRLAWCYGDAGALYGIYLSGKYLNDPHLCEFALSKLKKSAQRRDLKETGVLDAGFCHGSSSLACIFNKLYYHTGEALFKEAALYWYKVTIILGSNNTHPAGYLFYGGEGGWLEDDTFLNGITGVGFSLLAAFSYDHMEWDECVMLS